MKFDEEYYESLDGIRESGVSNMFGAAPLLQDRHPELSRSEAREILFDWITTYADRHPEEGN